MRWLGTSQKPIQPAIHCLGNYAAAEGAARPLFRFPKAELPPADTIVAVRFFDAVDAGAAGAEYVTAPSVTRLAERRRLETSEVGDGEARFAVRAELEGAGKPPREVAGCVAPSRSPGG